MTTKLDLLTAKEVAGILRVSTKTIYALIAAGKLASVRVGRVIRVPRSALDQFLSIATA
jgi:excisionase family DNA binding protein